VRVARILKNPEKRRMNSVLNEIIQSECRWADTDADISQNSPFRNFKHLQTNWPFLSFIKIPEYASEIDCELPSKYTIKSWLENSRNKIWSAEILNTTTQEIHKSNVFVKDSHLVDPIGLLKGEYSIPTCSVLPNYTKSWIKTYEKIQNRENQAYVDCFANFLLSRLRENNITPHCVLYYGCRLGLSDNYQFKITDQFESLRSKKWFWNSLERTSASLQLNTEDVDRFGFIIKNPHQKIVKESFDNIVDLSGAEDTHEGLNSEIGKNNELCDVAFDNIKEIDSEHKPIDLIKKDYSEQSSLIGSIHENFEDIDENKEGKNIEEDCDADADDDEDDEDDADADDDEDDEDDDDEDDEDDDDEDDEDDDEIEVTLVSKNIPVISIIQEAHDGVMDQYLNVDEIDGIVIDTPEWDNLWLAWIFQVVACLDVLQKAFLFTHNDLHTNNLVWRKTEQKYLYYQNKAGIIWKVPTYGRIFSIIDFGRAIFNFNNETFVSDDHWPGNYAGDQYNFGAFFNPEKPKIYPNPSFDLCRLAVSLLDGLFDEIPPPKQVSKSKLKRMKKQHIPIQPARILSREPGWTVTETESELFNLLWSWTVDDEGKTIYVNKDYSERNPGFDLYKKIAASVHKAIPREQFGRSEFNKFLLKSGEKISPSAKIYSVDAA